MAGSALIKFTKSKPLTIGLTGGPGVGKTEVAKILESKGAFIINADEIGHELLAGDKSVKRKLLKLFGEQILADDGTLLRNVIGGIVFKDQQMMFEFNAIIHPALLKELKGRLKQAVLSKRYNIIVVDAALIFEWAIADWFDMIIVVDAKRDLRLERIAKNGLSKYQASKRIGSQIPQRDKKALADYVLINNFSKRDLKKMTMTFYAELADKFMVKK